MNLNANKPHGSEVDLVVFAETDAALNEARHLGNMLEVSVVRTSEEACQHALHLMVNDDGLTLSDGSTMLRADFTSMLPRLKTANLRQELLVKAARIKGREQPINVLDATAGLGEDSLILAAAGFRVVLCEYDPVIAALLADAMRRGAENPALRDAVSRMELHQGDSITIMQGLDRACRPEVVLLDPMFPERRKSALVKKKFQLLHQLEHPCDNEQELLRAAMELSPLRIVIKRPAKGPFLAGVKPAYSLDGKAIRYDCIVPPSH